MALNSYSKKWDRLGKGYDTFANISWTDFWNYPKFDLFFNDIFVLGGQVIDRSVVWQYVECAVFSVPVFTSCSVNTSGTSNKQEKGFPGIQIVLFLGGIA